MLLRHALGETLRDARTQQSRTLRDVSTVANVSLGYLSEIERGRKEASSELLEAICDALDLELADVLDTASDAMRSVAQPVPALAAAHAAPRAAVGSATATAGRGPNTLRIVMPYRPQPKAPSIQ